MLNYFPKDVLPRDIERKTSNGLIGYSHEGTLIPCLIEEIAKESALTSPFPSFPWGLSPPQHYIEGADGYIFRLRVRAPAERVSKYIIKPPALFYTRVTDPKIMTVWPKLGYRMGAGYLLYFSRAVPGPAAWHIVPTLMNMVITDNEKRFASSMGMNTKVLWELYNPSFYTSQEAVRKMRRLPGVKGVAINNSLALLRKSTIKAIIVGLQGRDVGVLNRDRTVSVDSRYRFCEKYLAEQGFNIGESLVVRPPKTTVAPHYSPRLPGDDINLGSTHPASAAEMDTIRRAMRTPPSPTIGTSMPEEMLPQTFGVPREE